MSPERVRRKRTSARNPMAAKAIAVLKVSTKVKNLITFAQSVA